MSILIDKLIERHNKKDFLIELSKKSQAKNRMDKESIKEILLGFRYENNKILDEIADNIGFSFKKYLEDEKPYMTTEQINSLIRQGFTFGGHSRCAERLDTPTEQRRRMSPASTASHIYASDVTPGMSGIRVNHVRIGRRNGARSSGKASRLCLG